MSVIRIINWKKYLLLQISNKYNGFTIGCKEDFEGDFCKSSLKSRFEQICLISLVTFRKKNRKFLFLVLNTVIVVVYIYINTLYVYQCNYNLSCS